MSFIVREGKKEDVESIIEFQILLARESEDVELDREVVTRGVTRCMGDRNKGTYYVAEKKSDGKGEVIGCVMVNKEFSDWNDTEYYYLQSVYVKESERRKGVFTSLFKHVVSICKENNAASLRLYVEKDNITAQRTYEKLGMKQSKFKFYSMNF